MNLIRNKNLNPDKKNMINIQTEIDNRHPNASLNVLNTSTESSSSVIDTSTRHHHNKYEKLSFNDLDVTTHQTETVISNSQNSSLNTEKMFTDIKLNSMSTKQHASNDLKRDIPTLTHKQLINAYIGKKANEI